MLDDLHGRTALVTGSAQGLGRVFALELAAEGCRVLVNCHRHPEKAQSVADEIAQAGGEARVCVFDVANEREISDALCNEKVDILINNARLDPYKKPEDMSEGDWFAAMLRVKVIGAFQCIRYVSSGMKERRWGRIINVSSAQAHLGMPGPICTYGAANLALHSLTRSFARELGEYDITVNTLAPGMVITENFSKRLPEAEIKRRIANYPVHRASEASDIAKAAVFALKMGAVTGETINLNSGVYFPA